MANLPKILHIFSKLIRRFYGQKLFYPPEFRFFVVIYESSFAVSFVVFKKKNPFCIFFRLMMAQIRDRYIPRIFGISKMIHYLLRLLPYFGRDTQRAENGFLAFKFGRKLIFIRFNIV
jgi:hypothetical protein